jgi:hypothetical protein
MSQFTDINNAGPDLLKAFALASRNLPYWEDSRINTNKSAYSHSHISNTWGFMGTGGGENEAGDFIANFLPFEGTLYQTNGTTGSACRVYSSSSNDTSAGTGARTVTLIGLKFLNGVLNFATETLTMNGATPAAGAVLFATPPHAFVATVGSSGTNEGEIVIQRITPSNVQVGFIRTGAGQTETAHAHIPTEATGGGTIIAAGPSAPIGGMVYEPCTVWAYTPGNTLGIPIKRVISEGYDSNQNQGVWVPPGTYLWATAPTGALTIYASIKVLIHIA